jgi:hypothetical protein
MRIVYVKRSRREISEAFGRFFSGELRESDYSGAIASFADAVAPAARAFFRKPAFLVILSRKAAR